MNGPRLELARSWTFASLILALHCTAAASILIVMPSLSGAGLAAGFVALGAAAAWARALHASRGSVRALELANPLVVELRDGRRFETEVGSNRRVSRFIVTLPLRRPLRRTILVTRDMLAPEEFRRLRLWALWEKLPVAAKQLQG